MVMSRSLGAPHRALPTLAAVIVAMTVSGCGGDPAGPGTPAPATTVSPTAPDDGTSTTEPADDDGALAWRSTRGGMCPEGPCRSALVVHDDGTWNYEAEDGESAGRLEESELSELRAAVEDTGLTPDGEPATACAADSDGTSVTYGWSIDGQEHEVDSCDVLIDVDDPLVRAIDELAARVEG